MASRLADLSAEALLVWGDICLANGSKMEQAALVKRLWAVIGEAAGQTAECVEELRAAAELAALLDRIGKSMEAPQGPLAGVLCRGAVEMVWIEHIDGLALGRSRVAPQD